MPGKVCTRVPCEVGLGRLAGRRAGVQGRSMVKFQNYVNYLFAGLVVIACGQEPYQRTAGPDTTYLTKQGAG